MNMNYTKPEYIRCLSEKEIFTQVKPGDYFFKPSSDGSQHIRVFRVSAIIKDEIKYERIGDGSYAGCIVRSVPFIGMILQEGKEGIKLLIDKELDRQFNGERPRRKS